MLTPSEFLRPDPRRSRGRRRRRRKFTVRSEARCASAFLRRNCFAEKIFFRSFGFFPARDIVRFCGLFLFFFFFVLPSDRRVRPAHTTSRRSVSSAPDYRYRGRVRSRSDENKKLQPRRVVEIIVPVRLRKIRV